MGLYGITWDLKHISDKKLGECFRLILRGEGMINGHPWTNGAGTQRFGLGRKRSGAGRASTCHGLSFGADGDGWVWMDLGDMSIEVPNRMGT